jgi:hypothetical protein
MAQQNGMGETGSERGCMREVATGGNVTRIDGDWAYRDVDPAGKHTKR